MSELPARQPLPFPAVLVVTHGVLFAAVQLESALAHLVRPSDGPWSTLALLSTLGFAQAEALAVLAALALAGRAAARSRGARGALLSLAWLANGWVLLDQLAYRYFHDHYHLAMNEGRGVGMESIGFLRDSFFALIDRTFAFNVVLAVALAVWSVRAARRAMPPARGVPRGALIVAALVFLAGHLATRGRVDLASLDRHPLFALFAPVAERPDEARELDRGIFAPRFDTTPPDPAVSAALAKARAALTARKRPNVIVVILESVGAVGLLGADCKPVAKVAPFLASVAPHSVIFDSVYAPWFGTVRSHASILTGGRTITWGSAYGEFDRTFRGTNLPGSLKALGYRTATFASGDDRVHNLYSIYEHLGYDCYRHFGLEPYEFQLQHRVSSWGGDESAMLDSAFTWWDAERKADPGKPVLLQFNTITTHHPFAVPAGYIGPFPGAGDQERYLNSIHHTDAVLAELFAGLSERGLDRDTLVLITGDHGTTVGGLGVTLPQRSTVLFDEMCKSFLMIIDPSRKMEPVLVPGRVAANADILPTVLGLLGQPVPADVLGQDLLAPGWSPKLAFFHQGLTLGCRDGRFKFISRDRALESWSLYDVSADPRETVDLAAQHPERGRVYQDACLAWYAGVNAELVRYLDGELYPGMKLPRPRDVLSAGPTSISFGVRDALNNFTGKLVFNPEDQVTALSFWVGWPADKLIRVDWVDPDGRTFTVDQVVGSSEARVGSIRTGLDPFRPGLWTVKLSDGPRVLVSGRFLVSASAPASSGPGESRAAGLTGAALGTRDEVDGWQTRETKLFHAHESVAVRCSWSPFETEHAVRIDWVDPAGAVHGHDHRVQAGWTMSYSVLPAGVEMLPGRWTMQLAEGDRVLVAFPFRVLPSGDALGAAGPAPVSAAASPETSGQASILALRAELELAPAQVDRIDASLSRLTAARVRTRVEQERLRGQLARSLAIQAPIGELREIMIAVARSQVELALTGVKVRRALEATLTPEQLKRYDQLHPER